MLQDHGIQKRVLVLCQKANEIADELFEGNKCVTSSDEFKMVCLELSVLKTDTI